MMKYISILFFIILRCFPADAQETGNNNFIEKVYVRTDKGLYHTGEIMWFRMYVADGYFHSPVNLSKVGYVEVLDASNRPVLQGKISLDSLGGNGSFLIPSNIASGKYLLRAYTRWMRNFGADVFFEKNITLINTGKPSGTQVVSQRAETQPLQGKELRFVIKPGRPMYGTREKVSVEIIVSDENGKPVDADMSVAISITDSLSPAVNEGINDHLWSAAVGKKNAEIKYAPEFRGHIVEGTIKNRQGAFAAGVTGYLSVPGRHSIFNNSTSDSSGKIKFELIDFYGGGEMIVQTNSQTDNQYHIDIEDPFSSEYKANKTADFLLPGANPVTLLQQDMSAQIQKVFVSGRMEEFSSLSKDTSSFYGKEDMRYMLDNYTRFKTMEEVFREYVQPVGVTRKNGKFHTYIYDQQTRHPFPKDPLVLVDGVPVFDGDRLMEYDPLKVERIDVITKKYFQGRSAFNGIVSLSTYKGELEGYEPDANATVVDYEGLQLQRKFYSPVYETPEQKQDHLPDYRSVLYWSPEIMTGASGKATVEFYTSDLPGLYQVIVEGITPDGKCGWNKISFTVN